jgi:hypothetical protein
MRHARTTARFEVSVGWDASTLGREAFHFAKIPPNHAMPVMPDAAPFGSIPEPKNKGTRRALHLFNRLTPFGPGPA